MSFITFTDYQSFNTATDQLMQIDFENFLHKKTVDYYHHVTPFLIPNPLILDGVTFTSPSCLFATHNAHINNNMLFFEPNSKIYFPQSTKGVMLKLENTPNSIIKITNFSGESISTQADGLDSCIFLGFISQDGISSIEFVESNTFVASVFFTSSIH
ncbi:hypothetical protein QBE52_11175 [Clostridiaceae bacterium 35-E11]